MFVKSFLAFISGLVIAFAIAIPDFPKFLAVLSILPWITVEVITYDNDNTED